MKSSKTISLVSKAFAEAGIPFIVIGGTAVNYYKMQRTTFDLDVLLPEEDYEKVLPCLNKVGYKELRRHPVCIQLRHEDPHLMDVDIVLVSRETFQGILNQGQKVEKEDAQLMVPSLEHLMALKLHALKNNPAYREFPDLVDLVNLIEINQVDVNAESFQELCKKYGTSQLYDRIVKAIRARR